MIDHIPIIIRKLHRLASIILDLEGFRFYGCSLLLIYDGDRAVQSSYSKHIHLGGISEREEHGMNDPVASVDASNMDREDNEEEDEFAEHRHTNTLSTRRGSPPPTVGRSDRRSRSADVKSSLHPGRHASRHHKSHERPHSQQPGDNNTPPANKRVRGEVNIRIVDFAHTTTGQDIIPMPPGEDVSGLGKGYETKYDETTGKALARFPPKFGRKADMGFLFGLKSCCEALTGIWEEATGKVGGVWDEVGAGDEGVEGVGEGVRDVFERAFPDGVEDVLST